MEMNRESIVVTGVAGFIGAYVARYLLERNIPVIGIDNINNYYSQELKRDRLEILKPYKHFTFYKLDIDNYAELTQVFERHEISKVIHLAAQAGVRYSIENPHEYSKSNLSGFLNILEVCRAINCEHLIYASSSSVYGLNKTLPFSVSDNVDHPASLYAATKKSNELMAHSYSHLYSIPTTGLRFFTVYGPWGRPDMAPMIFANKIMRGQPIEIFNNGLMSRDFTYVDDIVESVCRLALSGDSHRNGFEDSTTNNGSKFYRIFNIGAGRQTNLMDFVQLLEDSLEIKANKVFRSMQPGDVENTWADTKELENVTGYKPKFDISYGVPKFVEWYKSYYV